MSTPPGGGSPDGEQLRKFLEQIFGGSLPPGALDGMDFDEMAKQSGLPTDPVQLQAAAAQLRGMMSASGDGPVNWQMTHDLARQGAIGHGPALPGREAAGSPGDPTPGPGARSELADAFRLAQLWLDPVVSFDAAPGPVAVWSRAEWVEQTLQTWKRLVEPVAKYMAGAIGDAMSAQLEEMPEELKGMAGATGIDPRQMMTKMGGTLYGVQFGVAIGHLSREVLSGSDLGLPLTPDGQPALLAANIDDFLEGQDVERSAAVIFLAAREAAHTALFAGVPWLAEHLWGTVESYARGIRLDLSRLEEQVRDLDLSDPTKLQHLRPEDMFDFSRTPEQERALDDLSTVLALIEGWVDHVVLLACEHTLPQLDALREIMRRRRASGGPAEEALSAVVGLELRPKRIREAFTWWEERHQAASEGGPERDEIWGHPDLLPSAADLAEGSATVVPDDVEVPEDPVDVALAALLRGEGAEEAPVEDAQGGVREAGDADDDEPGGDNPGDQPDGSDDDPGAPGDDGSDTPGDDPDDPAPRG